MRGGGWVFVGVSRCTAADIVAEAQQLGEPHIATFFEILQKPKKYSGMLRRNVLRLSHGVMEAEKGTPKFVWRLCRMFYDTRLYMFIPAEEIIIHPNYDEE